jgi:hypothetical protein
MFTIFVSLRVFAQAEDGVGQTIQITTRFHSLAGKPSWLLEIRDLDHDQNIPYIYDITQGDNFWLVFTYGHHYLITASTMQFAPYRSNPYRTKVTHDFCHLESHGTIARGESLSVNISGDLSPNTGGYTCNVTRFKDSNFSVPSTDSGPTD